MKVGVVCAPRAPGLIILNVPQTVYSLWVHVMRACPFVHTGRAVGI